MAIDRYGMQNLGADQREADPNAIRSKGRLSTDPATYGMYIPPDFYHGPSYSPVFGGKPRFEGQNIYSEWRGELPEDYDPNAAVVPDPLKRGQGSRAWKKNDDGTWTKRPTGYGGIPLLDDGSPIYSPDPLKYPDYYEEGPGPWWNEISNAEQRNAARKAYESTGTVPTGYAAAAPQGLTLDAQSQALLAARGGRAPRSAAPAAASQYSTYTPQGQVVPQAPPQPQPQSWMQQPGMAQMLGVQGGIGYLPQTPPGMGFSVAAPQAQAPVPEQDARQRSVQRGLERDARYNSGGLVTLEGNPAYEAFQRGEYGGPPAMAKAGMPQQQIYGMNGGAQTSATLPGGAWGMLGNSRPTIPGQMSPQGVSGSGSRDRGNTAGAPASSGLTPQMQAYYDRYPGKSTTSGSTANTGGYPDPGMTLQEYNEIFSPGMTRAEWTAQYGPNAK